MLKYLFNIKKKFNINTKYILIVKFYNTNNNINNFYYYDKHLNNNKNINNNNCKKLTTFCKICKGSGWLNDKSSNYLFNSYNNINFNYILCNNCNGTGIYNNLNIIL